MGFFGKLWNSAKTLGKKVLGWGHKAHAIGKKAKYKTQVIILGTPSLVSYKTRIAFGTSFCCPAGT